MQKNSAQGRWMIFPIVVMMSAIASAEIGEEVSSYERLEDGEEFVISQRELIRRGEAAFSAQWT